MKKQVISLVVAVAILAAIYSVVDVDSILQALRDVDRAWFVTAVLLTIVTVSLTAGRLVMLTPRLGAIGFAEAVRLTLVASTLNLFLPSKAGDLVKGIFIARENRLSTALSFSLVIAEKAWDLVALLVICCIALLYLPDKDSAMWSILAGIAVTTAAACVFLTVPEVSTWLLKRMEFLAENSWLGKVRALIGAWHQQVLYVRSKSYLCALTAAWSLAIWFVHLVQIWMFAHAISPNVDFIASFALAPLAILVGLLPISIAGVGTRDAALIVLYAPYLSPAEGAVLGLFCTLRYIIPALAGAPFAYRYLRLLRSGRGDPEVASAPEPVDSP